MRRWQFPLTLVTIGLVALSLTVVTMRGVAADTPTAPSQQSNQIGEKLAGWEYFAAPGDGAFNVIVNYDKGSAQGINAFAAANRQLVDQVNGSVEATVVFKQPITASEFKDLIGKSGVQVKAYTMRAISGTGLRATIAGAPLGNDLFPQAALDGLVRNVNQKQAGVVFKGVVTVDVTANQRQLKQLLADGRVYTTDVTQSVAIGRARAKAVTNAAMSKANVASLPTKSRLAAPLYWYMEDMGIAPQ